MACAGVLVTTVTDEDTFLVDHAFSISVRIIVFMHRIIFPAAFEGHRQTPGGVHLAKEDFRERDAALLSRIPGLNQRGHSIHPSAHVYAAARGHDDDRYACWPRSSPESTHPARPAEQMCDQRLRSLCPDRILLLRRRHRLWRRASFASSLTNCPWRTMPRRVRPPKNPCPRGRAAPARPCAAPASSGTVT